MVKHSGKRSCCNSTPRHPRRRRVVFFFFSLSSASSSFLLTFSVLFPFARHFCGFLQLSFFELFFFFSLILCKPIYSYILVFSRCFPLSLSFSFSRILSFTFRDNYAITEASILKQSFFNLNFWDSHIYCFSKLLQKRDRRNLPCLIMSI